MHRSRYAPQRAARSNASPALLRTSALAALCACLSLSLSFGPAGEANAQSTTGSGNAGQGGTTQPPQRPATGPGSAPGGLEVVPDDIEQGTAPEAGFERVLIREIENNKDWTVRFNAEIAAIQPRGNNRREIGLTGRIDIEGALFVMQLPDDSAYADVYEGTVEQSYRAGDLRRVESDADLLGGYQSGQRLVVNRYGDVEVTVLRNRLAYELTSYETDIDDERAAQIPWHTEPFTDEKIVSSLLPQLFVESDDALIVRLVEEWTNGQPKKVPPYVLAKFLAGRVLEYYQVTEGPYLTVGRGPRRGVFTSIAQEGFNTRGAAYAARRQRGSYYDLANLLCAVYRAAGLPARLVIGYDHRFQDSDDDYAYIAWVEFYLYHPEAQRGEWIPVDIRRQQLFSSRAPDLDTKWEFFGKNDDAEYYIPLAHHWKPPTAVITAGPPALFGWLPDTEGGDIPVVDGRIYTDAFETPIRPSDPDFEERQRRRNNRPR